VVVKGYEQIASAIDFIKNDDQSQPSWNDIAHHLNLTPSQLQDLFIRWAGVSVKHFLHMMTLQSAQQLLRKTEANLSNAAHVYQQSVQLVVLTAADYRKLGQGETLSYGVHVTPFGQALIAMTERGICKLVFTERQSITDIIDELSQQWPLAVLKQNLALTEAILEQIFTRKVPIKQTLTLFVKATEFQLAVWQALLLIPKGQLASYSQIALAISKPKAVRAVASAIAANPIAYLIPCHRVIRLSGEMGGYRWGISRKYAMIINETAHIPNLDY